MKEAAHGQAEAGNGEQWRSGELQGRLCWQKHQSSLLTHRHTAKGEALLFSLVPAQAIVSIDLKPVPLPPKLKSFDKRGESSQARGTTRYVTENIEERHIWKMDSAWVAA